MANSSEKSYIVRWESSSHKGKYEYLILMRATRGEVWMAIDQIGSPPHGETRVLPTSKARGLVFYQEEYSEENENAFKLYCSWGSPEMLWEESEPVGLPEKPGWYVPYRG